MISARVEVLEKALRRFIDDPEEARAVGEAARRYALSRYGLGRFLADWEDVLMEVGG